jgi:hypothetical protein
VEERDVGQVIRAIKAHALMHREHRDRDQDGQIVANVVDYILVSELMNDILAEGSGLAVSPAVAKTTEAVIEATAEMNTDEGATAQAIGKILKLDKSAARRRLVKAANEGFVVNLETRKGQPGRYRATGQSKELCFCRNPRCCSPANPPPTPKNRLNRATGTKKQMTFKMMTVASPPCQRWQTPPPWQPPTPRWQQILPPINL